MYIRSYIQSSGIDLRGGDRGVGSRIDFGNSKVGHLSKCPKWRVLVFLGCYWVRGEGCYDCKFWILESGQKPCSSSSISAGESAIYFIPQLKMSIIRYLCFKVIARKYPVVLNSSYYFQIISRLQFHCSKKNIWVHHFLYDTERRGWDTS